MRQDRGPFLVTVMVVGETPSVWMWSGGATVLDAVPKKAHQREIPGEPTTHE